MEKNSTTYNDVLLFVLLSLFFAAGCEEAPAIVQVCSDYSVTNGVCGTGFFVDTKTLVTTKHVVDDGDGTLTVVVPYGENASPYKMEVYGEILVAYFSEEVGPSEQIKPICNDVVLENDVDIIGVLDAYDGPEAYSGEVYSRTQQPFGPDDLIDNWLLADVSVQFGFSGGPVYDRDRGCFVGVVWGYSPHQGFTVASDLTLVKTALTEAGGI